MFNIDSPSCFNDSSVVIKTYIPYLIFAFGCQLVSPPTASEGWLRKNFHALSQLLCSALQSPTPTNLSSAEKDDECVDQVSSIRVEI